MKVSGINPKGRSKMPTTNQVFCKHEHLKKDRYGKEIQEFISGRGTVCYCADCGIRMTTIKWTNPTRPRGHMSKKDRRLDRKIRKEIALSRAGSNPKAEEVPK